MDCTSIADSNLNELRGRYSTENAKNLFLTACCTSLSTSNPGESNLSIAIQRERA